MDKIVTVDCPQCGGRGFLSDGGNTFPCAQCCRRWDLANPCPSPRFIHMNCTMAEFTSMLRTASKNIDELWTQHDEDVHQSAVETVQMLLQRSADFIASHDPSTRKRLSEEDSPYCNACEFDHPPGECGL